MSNDTKYNGWTNYATWRVNLEMFDGAGFDVSDYEWMRKWSALKDYAEEYICDTTPEGLGRDYALAFLNEVNWFEIASHYETEWLASELSEFDDVPE